MGGTAGAIWLLIGVFIGALIVWLVMIVTGWPGGTKK